MNKGINIMRPMPGSMEAEEVVLAGILKDNDCILDVMDLIGADDFYFRPNRELYAFMKEMFTKGMAIETGTLANYMGMEKLKDLGGVSYLASLTDILVTKANYRDYVDIVLDKSMRRKAISACLKAVNEAYEGDIMKAIDDLEYELLSLRGAEKTKTLNADELMACTLAKIEDNYNHKSLISGITTGYEKLDKATNGYQKGDLWTIAARPSIGKTMVAMNLLERLPSQYKAAFFELEMSETKIGNRLIALKSGIQSSRLLRGQLSEKDFINALEAANKVVLKDNIFVNCKSAATLSYIRMEAKKIKLRHGLDVIFIDHIGLMKGLRDYRGNRNMEISEITSGLKGIAKDLGVSVICLSQLNRAVEGRMDKHPVLSDLRDSGSIEQDSDTVISLYRDEYYNRDTDDKGLIDFEILKNRDGQVGRLTYFCNLPCQIVSERRV